MRKLSEYSGKGIVFTAVVIWVAGEILSRLLGGLIGQALGTATEITAIILLAVGIARGIMNTWFKKRAE